MVNDAYLFFNDAFLFNDAFDFKALFCYSLIPISSPIISNNSYPFLSNSKFSSKLSKL